MIIDGNTQLTGLLGSPVSHSISPLMHNEAFRLRNLNYVYLCFDVGTEGLKTAIEGLRTIGVKGFNCTMPDKNLMCELADSLSPAAEIIGAVNTVVNTDGKFIGHNTDGIGYMRSLTEDGHNIIGKKMTLLGAGGAATAIATQAALDGAAEINIFSRKSRFWERAQHLADTLNKNTSSKVSLYEMNDDVQLRKSISESTLLTNGTSVGMAPDENNSIITDTSLLHEGLIVSDVVYNPRETRLLQLAKANKCIPHSGLGMLLYQGAEAFKIWTGEDMPVTFIKEKYFE